MERRSQYNFIQRRNAQLKTSIHGRGNRPCRDIPHVTVRSWTLPCFRRPQCVSTCALGLHTFPRVSD
eukprot:9384586-Prorocentrum_lima.AAC.1